MKIKAIRLANSVKCGKNENTSFYDESVQVRDASSTVEIVAMKVPVIGASDQFYCQPIVKITDKYSGKTVYTSLMNTIYWEMDEQEDLKKKGKK